MSARTRWTLSCVAGAFGLIGGLQVAAESPTQGEAKAATTPLSTPALVELVRNAKAQFQPLPRDHAARAKRTLQQSVERLGKSFRSSSADNAQRWRDYLQWDVLTAELAKPEGPDTRQLGQIAARLFQNYGSLERPVFTQVRDDLVAYLAALSAAGDPQLAETYQAQLDQLMDKLVQYEAGPTTDLRQQLGQLIGWLENSRQAPGVVAAVRASHARPNLFAEVSERLVSRGMGDELTQQSDVRDCILGTSITGTAVLRGRTQVRLAEHPNKAHLQIVLSGVVDSDNVGLNRGVQIFSHAVTQVSATKSVLLDPLGSSSLSAAACCTTETAIHDICAKSRFVERIAWKRAAKSKGEAEQIGSRHAEERIAQQMDERAGEVLAEARESYQENFRRPLLRRGEFPQLMQFSTRSGFLRVAWRQASTAQLAASSPPPPIGGTRDLAVRAHESMVSNFSRAMIGGVTLTDRKLVEILEQYKAEVPEALRISDDKEPWSITFAANDPVNATFADDTIRFAIRGRRFGLGDRVVNNTLEMSAIYKLEKTPAGARLIRQGDVSVDYIDLRGQLRVDQIAVRTVMREKFEALFVPEFNTVGLELPGRWGKVGKLQLVHMAAQQGWVALAWCQQEPRTTDSRLAQSKS
ncbi:MAG: hypothetical protein MUF48_07495 [Pirellulaceae bacterium]|jgi:hypothetical protein|nr:hypothetical protein [Pirellulaceae bacterium]